MLVNYAHYKTLNLILERVNEIKTMVNKIHSLHDFKPINIESAPKSLTLLQRHKNAKNH